MEHAVLRFLSLPELAATAPASKRFAAMCALCAQEQTAAFQREGAGCYEVGAFRGAVQGNPFLVFGQVYCRALFWEYRERAACAAGRKLLAALRGRGHISTPRFELELAVMNATAAAAGLDSASVARVRDVMGLVWVSHMLQSPSAYGAQPDLAAEIVQAILFAAQFGHAAAGREDALEEQLCSSDDMSTMKFYAGGLFGWAAECCLACLAHLGRGEEEEQRRWDGLLASVYLAAAQQSPGIGDVRMQDIAGLAPKRCGAPGCLLTAEFGVLQDTQQRLGAVPPEHIDRVWADALRLVRLTQEMRLSASYAAAGRRRVHANTLLALGWLIKLAVVADEPQNRALRPAPRHPAEAAEAALAEVRGVLGVGDARLRNAPQPKAARTEFAFFFRARHTILEDTGTAAEYVEACLQSCVFVE